MDTRMLLRHLQTYVDFSEEEFSEFIKLFVPFHLKKNAFFYKAGEVPRYSPFIVKGCLIQYYTTQEGEERIVRIIEENEWAGQIGSMRSNIPTDLYLKTYEDCELLGITIENADYGMDHFPAYRKFFSKKYPFDHARLLQEANRIKSDTPENLYMWLMEERPSLILRVPQHYIANYLGIRTETISRIRKKMTQQ